MWLEAQVETRPHKQVSGSAALLSDSLSDDFRAAVGVCDRNENARQALIPLEPPSLIN